MRICAYLQGDVKNLGFYFDDHIVPLQSAMDAYHHEQDESLPLENTDSPLPFLTCGEEAEVAHKVAHWLNTHEEARLALAVATDKVTLQAPLSDPPKILLLAGNYASHLAEENEKAEEKENTFPYIFMKPRTTINHPNADVVIPKISPDFIDYECELGIIMGKTAKGVKAAEALDYVAGYTVVNDVSDRKFKPNPGRVERPRDGFFDWLHGKWHDGFFVSGPAIISAQSVPNPNDLNLHLEVNGETRQETNTDRMICFVGDVIEFISDLMTLEPGDIIATGTTAGVGMTSGKLLRPGDVTTATIDGIGTLTNTFVAEA